MKGRMAELLFPRKCPFCGKPTGKKLLCDNCRRDLPYTGQNALRRGAIYGRCAVPLYYESGVRRAVLDLKFHGAVGGLDCFGELLASCAAEQFPGEFDAVTWVPISENRLRHRGYDQARCLAESTCTHWGVRPTATLRKIVDNVPQSGLRDIAERRGNVLGVYEVVSVPDIAGRRWLLVDDVLTTGATMGECARMLREAGAAEVVCLALATPR